MQILHQSNHFKFQPKNVVKIILIQRWYRDILKVITLKKEENKYTQRL